MTGRERRTPPRWRGLARAATLAATAFALLAFARAPAFADADDQDSLTLTLTLRDVWPPAPVTDLRATPGTEGQLLLEWTAPGEDHALTIQNGLAVAAYEIRSATFSVAAMGSTQAWSAAALPLGGVPSPLQPARAQSMLLNNLEPGATYWFGIRSTDDEGQISDIDAKAASPGAQASALVYDAPPSAPANLRMVSSNTVALLAWDAVAATDLDFYRLRIDTTAPYDFTDAATVDVDSTSLTYSLPLAGGTSYYLRIHAVDKGAPFFAGRALESGPSNLLVIGVSLPPRPPLAPVGFDAVVGGGNISLSWIRVSGFDDGTPFQNPANPSASELEEIQVQRSTGLGGAPWTAVASLAATATSYSEAVAAGSYYRLLARNAIGFSKPSVVRSAATGSAFVVAPDSSTVLELTSSRDGIIVGDGITIDSVWRIEASSHPEDLGGRVLKSVEFLAYKGGSAAPSDLQLAEMAVLKLRYEQAGSLVVPSSLGPAAVTPTPENIGVYWYNGKDWIQLYGRSDEANRYLVVETRYLGRYQLRAVERVGGFNFDQSGLSNRFITPNGDGRNDAAVFIYNNPRGSSVSGKIFDLKGAYVADMTPGPVQDSLKWDGMANGSSAPGGVYIYQISSEDMLFNGTVVVIK